jgi:hypothetical protein
MLYFELPPSPPHQVSQEDVKKILANFDNSEALALNGVSVAGTK